MITIITIYFCLWLILKSMELKMLLLPFYESVLKPNIDMCSDSLRLQLFLYDNVHAHGLVMKRYEQSLNISFDVPIGQKECTT